MKKRPYRFIAARAFSHISKSFLLNLPKFTLGCGFISLLKISYLNFLHAKSRGTVPRSEHFMFAESSVICALAHRRHLGSISFRKIIFSFTPIQANGIWATLAYELLSTYLYFIMRSAQNQLKNNKNHKYAENGCNF